MPSPSLCRAAVAAAEGLEEGREGRAAEPPADALLPAASADLVAVVVEKERTPPGTCEESVLGPDSATKLTYLSACLT